MAGQFRHLGASSSTRARQQEEIKRKQEDAAREEEAKRQRHSQLNVAARPTGGAAVRVVPLHHAARDAMAMAFPVAGVNGAALRWSTAATQGEASRTAAVPLPAMTSFSTGAAPPPFVLAPPVPLQVIGYGAMAGAIAPPAPAFGMPLTAALDKLKNDALGSMLSALMPACDPPVEQRLGWARPPPPWWPTASEDWWVPELVAHLFTMPAHTPVPFAPAYRLKKAQKVAVLVAIVKHHSPDLDRMSSKAMCDKANLTVPEANLWKSALWNEAARYKANLSVPRPPAVFNFVLLQPPHGDGHRQAASCASCATATTENAVRGGGGIAAATDGGCEHGANLVGASVAAPAAGVGQVVAAAEPEQRQEQHSDDVVHGGVVATDGLPDGGPRQPVNFPGDDGAPLGDDVHQVAGELDLHPGPEQRSGMCVDDLAATADMDQLLEDMLAPFQMQQGEEVHQAIDTEVPGAEAAVEAPEGRPWYVEDDVSRFFEDFEVPVGTPHSYYLY
ncbi:hypothetical protein C2845_PM04G07050 [Panicum miliaceum]|uniref:Ethylene insensitive 3-like DNA-binding domain-containing protein n=1 Tax=Panicum miliaceum TaxID=4540 RepID=A0A3L6QR03_PANMI|nr:hypothetical protein C2845_PM04G07050 [Panicum miliaceum]